MQRCLGTLLSETLELFGNENAIVDLKSKNAMIIGDLHGNLEALEFLLDFRTKTECKDMVFLGDYIDKGEESVAVLSRLLELKLEEPENITLLRGNHETIEVNRSHGFYDEVQDDSLFCMANRNFDAMPIAAIINRSIFCVHGGIPGPVSLENISKEEAYHFLWSDPSGYDGISASIRGSKPQCFGADIFNEFMKTNGLSLMIRGHTALFTGYAWCFDKRLLSIFSTPEYTGKPNVASFAFLKGHGLSVFVYGRTGECYSLISTNF